MPTTIHAAGSEAGARVPLEIVAKAARQDVAPDSSRTLDLGGRIALLYVRFGVLSVGGRSGPRALPGEWVRVDGVTALEYANASRTENLRVCEIVFTQRADGAEAGVEQRYFSDDEKVNHLCPVASAESEDGAMTLGLDASVYMATLGRWSTVLHDLRPGRGAWTWVLSGDATVNNQKLESGDSAFIVDEDEVRISGGAGADVMLLEAAGPAAAGVERE